MAPPTTSEQFGGKEKAEIVYECVRLGLVNHLAGDQELARELERLCSVW